MGALMRRLAYVFLLVVAVTAGLSASEVADGTPGPLTVQDWWKSDRVQWSTDSINIATLQELRAAVARYSSTNTFLKALLNNVRRNKPEEYKSVTQRNAGDDYATLLLEAASDKPEISRVRFFHATTIVTSWSAIGAVDSSVGDNVIIRNVGTLFGSAATPLTDALELLRAINQELYAKNLPVLDKLLNSWDQPRDPTNNRRR